MSLTQKAAPCKEKNMFLYQYILKSVYSRTYVQNNFDPTPHHKYNNYTTQNTFSS